MPGTVASTSGNATGGAAGPGPGDQPLSQGPHPGTLEAYLPGTPETLDPAVDYETVGLGIIQNVYQTLITDNGNSGASFLPVLATCVPGTAQCIHDYGTSLVVNGTDGFSGEPVYWTFVIDPGARFYDSKTGASWGVYPSDVMFSVARDLAWSDPWGTTGGWVLAQALLPTGNAAWDGGFHTPYNTTPSNILGSMLVNDSRYCPQTSPGVFAGHGCITFILVSYASVYSYFLELLSTPFGTSIVPCGWFTAQSAGLPGWNLSFAPHGDGSCRLPNGGTTTNSSSWSSYLASLGPKSWDSLEHLLESSWPAPQPSVQWATTGSGPYYLRSLTGLNSTPGYTLGPNPAYSAPAGCSGEDGLAAYNGTCEPAPGAYIGNVTATWENSSNDSTALAAAATGTLDFGVMNTSHTADWVTLKDQDKVGLVSLATESLNGLNFNFDWNRSAYSAEGFPEVTNFTSGFFAATAVRGLLTASYPYAAIQSSVWTVDGLQYMVPSGGPIPPGMVPYSTAIYPPTGNVSFPGGSPNTDPNVIGGAAWWWTQATEHNSSYFDPELAMCSSDSPCSFPIVSFSSSWGLGAAITDLIQTVEQVTGGALDPFLYNISFNAWSADLSTGGLPMYVAGWSPDYLDPTDYLVPYAQGGAYSAWDSLASVLGSTSYDDGALCGYVNASFANLVYWGTPGPITSWCSGVAFHVAQGWMHTAAEQPPGTTRVLLYDLISRVLSRLDLYLWMGESVGEVAVGPWIDPTSVNANPMAGGSGMPVWYQLRYLTGPFSSSISVGASPGTPMFDPENDEIYVPNGNSSTLTVVSGATDQVLTSIPVGTDPQTPVLDPASGTIYVANSGSDNVSVINATRNVVVAIVPVGTDPSEPALAGPYDELFVPNSGSGTVTTISTVSGAVLATLTVGTAPAPPVYDPVNLDVYVPNYGSANVTVINASLDRVTGSIPVGSGPGTPAFDPTTRELYVPDFSANAVSVIDTATNTVVATIAVGTLLRPAVSPSTVVFGFSRTTAPAPKPLYDPANGEVYVVNTGSGNVSVISGARHAIVSTIAVGADPTTPVYDPADGNIYIANTGSENISVVSGTENTVVDSIAAGTDPSPPVFDNSSGQLYVPNTGSGNVSTVTSSYYVTFTETGLPSGASWHVTLGAPPPSTGAMFHRTTVPFPEANGTYPYTIAGPSGYRVVGGLAPSGSVMVHGQDVPEAVDFAPARTDKVTFHESGLPKGVAWCPTLGWSECSSAASVAFANLTPGQYAFKVPAIAGFRLTVLPGGSRYSATAHELNLSTSALTVKVTFVPVLYALTFQGSGLPKGKSWSVSVQYVYHGRTLTKHASSKTFTIAFEVPNATYVYTVGKVKGYTEAVHGAVSVAGSPITVVIAFTKTTDAAVRAAAPAPPERFGTLLLLRVLA